MMIPQRSRGSSTALLSRSGFAVLPLHPVLRPRFGFALPLHVLRRVGATTSQSGLVVDDVARAGAGLLSRRWARLFMLKLVFRSRAAADPALAVALTGG